MWIIKINIIGSRWQPRNADRLNLIICKFITKKPNVFLARSTKWKRLPITHNFNFGKLFPKTETRRKRPLPLSPWLSFSTNENRWTDYARPVYGTEISSYNANRSESKQRKPGALLMSMPRSSHLIQAEYSLPFFLNHSVSFTKNTLRRSETIRTYNYKKIYTFYTINL